MSDSDEKIKFGIEFCVYEKDEKKGKYEIRLVEETDWCSSLKNILSTLIVGSRVKKLKDFEIIPNPISSTEEKKGSQNNERTVKSANGSNLKILFCKMKYLHYDELFKYIVKYHYQVNKKKFSPILLISTDFLNYLKLSENDDNKEIIKNLNIEKRKYYWDSSIWNRYLHLYDNNFKQNFEHVLLDYHDAFSRNLFLTHVSQEFIEFQTRMMHNSFLRDFGSYSHSSKVIPFKFHSETYMEKEIDEKLKKKICKYKWRILIVDDYADICLKQDKKGNKLSRKWKIICKLLNRDLTNKCSDKDCTDCTFINKVEKDMDDDQIKLPFRFYTPIAGCKEERCNQQGWSKQVKLVEKSYGALKDDERTYDIVLIDYLLGINGKSNEREFSSELIDIIKSDYSAENSRYNNIKTPFGKAYLFPISAFSNALLDDLRENGISHHCEHWELASGADPINTPKQFMYKFAHFLGVQIKDSRIEESFLDYYDFIRYYPIIDNYNGNSLLIKNIKNRNVIKVISNPSLRDLYLRLLRIKEYSGENNPDYLESKQLLELEIKSILGIDESIELFDFIKK